MEIITLTERIITSMIEKLSSKLTTPKKERRVLNSRDHLIQLENLGTRSFSSINTSTKYLQPLSENRVAPTIYLLCATVSLTHMLTLTEHVPRRAALSSFPCMSSHTTPPVGTHVHLFTNVSRGREVGFLGQSAKDKKQLSWKQVKQEISGSFCEHSGLSHQVLN